MIVPMEYAPLLSHLGLDAKANTVYLSLLTLGPSPVRSVAAHSKINRGTTHQLLKELIQQGLVSYYHKQKRQYFVAESPEKLLSLSRQKVEEVEGAHALLEQELPNIQSMASNTGSTIVRSYEGSQGIRSVLEEVLSVVSTQREKTYRAYSTAEIRETLYRSFPHFTKQRIARGIFVQVIAIGKGGEHQEQSERRWLKASKEVPTYRIIFADRVAVISQSQNGNGGTLRAVVIQDAALAATEVILFDQLWKTLDV